MALYLGKKLAQVVNGTSGSSSGDGNPNLGVAFSSSLTTTTDSGVQDNLPSCSAITCSSELFNISKAKKIELPSLSSRLVASETLMPTTIEWQTAITTSTPTFASTDAKHLPILQSDNLTKYTTSAFAHSATLATTETESTVIISFNSSQAPVQYQPPLTIAGPHEHPHHQPQKSDQLHSAEAHETITETISSLSLPNNSKTAQMGSPICTPKTPKNNVLKKVASFTIEKSSGCRANCKNSNGNPNFGSPGQLESSTSKRLTFVPDKLCFAAYEKFEGQMLMKWLISSLQNNCKHLSEHDVSMLTFQYCNNLISVGVLKQISEKNDLETFKPFQMYQWTHTEAPIISQPFTPAKLGKVTSWHYSITPTSAGLRIPKSIQVDIPQIGKMEKENEVLQIFKKILNCTSITEVHALICDMLPMAESSRRSSKRCVLLSDLINDSESTIYQYNKNNTATSSGCHSVAQDAEIPTEMLSSALKEYVCSKCKNNNEFKSQQEIMKSDKEVQVFLNGEIIESNEKSSIIPPFPRNTLVAQLQAPPPPLFKCPTPPPPPPPPPPPYVSANILTATTSSISNISRLRPLACVASKACSFSMPAPLPNPAEGGWFNQASTLRKIAMNPPKPMKPLYWTRIVTQAPTPQEITSIPHTTCDDVLTRGLSSDESATFQSSSAPKEIWQEIDETNLDNIEEFTELFSREAIMPKALPKIKTQARARPIKVLDSKRSQNVGILLRSSHIDFYEIEHAIYHVDTSVVSLETLQQINKNKATNEELERIKEQGETTLDEPEQFLLKISRISLFTERISCMVFMAEFEETATVIERKLEVVMQLSQFLMESEELKLIFAIILTLGNYMNGGNRQRGQADGFTLDILSKLKDVKSKDSQTTLLHFIVRTYISRKRKDGVQLLEIPLPIPEPSDVERATQVDFDEVKGHISKLNDQLKSKKRTTDKVIIHSTDQTTEPFKSKMEKFIKNSSKQIEKLFKELDDCREVFIETMIFYHYSPKSGGLEQCTPNDFFEHWTNFTNDFKDIMKKEIGLLWNELMKKSKDVQTRKTVKTTKVKPGCLKERIMRLNKK